MNVLVFGPHPDDIEERISGTLFKLKKQGAEIFLCVATNGEIGSYRMTKEETARVRHGEAQAAADRLGATLIWMGERDEFIFDDEPTRLKFIDAVRQARPDVIFAPPCEDYNQDHDITGYMAFEARVLATVKAIETEHEVIDHIPPMFYYSPYGLAKSFKPQYFVDITDVMEDKLEMLSCHKSQMGDWCKDAFGVDYTAHVVNENKYWASCCGTPGVEYVEPLMICERWPIIAGAHKLLP